MAQIVRYNTIFMCTQKLTKASLVCQTKKVMKKLKTKNQDAQKKRSSHKVRGVSPEARRESMVGKICERGRS